MALGTNHLSNAAASVQEFVPELWSDDIIAAYKSNLVAANLISKMNHVGKKGDSIHIPKPTRGSASVKAVATQVTLNQNNSSEIEVPLGAHYEYSSIIEDILEVQALSSLRKFTTDDAGYALSTRIDTDIINTFSAAAGGMSISSGAMSGNDVNWATSGNAKVYYNNSGTPTAYVEATTAATALTDAFLRNVIQEMDDNDVPMSGRVLLLPPSAKNDLIGIDRYTEQAFVGEAGGSNSIRNGRVGDIYGMEVFITSNMPWVDTNAERIGLMFHKDAVILAEQTTVRTQTQYKQEYLGNLFTSDCIYGTQKARDEAAIAFAIPA